MTLFDLPPVKVRCTDPDTSKVAADIDRRGLRGQVAEVLAGNPAGLTDWEITGQLGLPDRRKPSVGKRRQECGAIDTGLRRPSANGMPCVVWALPREAE